MKNTDLYINGEPRMVSSQTVETLLQELNLGSKKIAVELNREIVPRDSYQTTKLQPGDRLEIVHFVGGG